MHATSLFPSFSHSKLAAAAYASHCSPVNFLARMKSSLDFCTPSTLFVNRMYTIHASVLSLFASASPPSSPSFFPSPFFFSSPATTTSASYTARAFSTSPASSIRSAAMKCNASADGSASRPRSNTLSAPSTPASPSRFHSA